MSNYQCPNCGSKLSYESVGSYGDIYDINSRNGMVCAKRRARVHYEHGDAMVYCRNCGTSYDFKVSPEGRIVILEECS